MQETIDTIAALKARPAADRKAEERLQARLAETLGPLIDQVTGAVADRGVLPSDETSAQLLIGDLTDLRADLLRGPRWSPRSGRVGLSGGHRILTPGWQTGAPRGGHVWNAGL